ncbi:hypothetical protein [Vibrio sp. SCSIO 43136]|uniref:hypothetical protein n=1 Tax=Vibrio sp. SCSIO 43136 TaxID=2819101 RepID=UPI00207574AC|nr:hypothetical protein [Vibrio sp. SCSIO 43136]USD68143.1 hypothetical protein J4N39_18385 [Vibrio sp. SCSIO 43136]
MSYGFEFETGTGKVFRLDDIQPRVYIEERLYKSGGTWTIKYPQYAGLAKIHAELIGFYIAGGSPNRFSYSYAQSALGEVTLTVSTTSTSSQTEFGFRFYAEFISDF